jgi:molecular chaperone GrpE
MNTQNPNSAEGIQQAMEEMEAQFATDASSDNVFDAAIDAASDIQTPEQLIAVLENQVSEHRKRELQAQAELENFRKRIMRDSEQQLKYANLPLLRDMLDVVDNLSRAIASSVKNSSESQSGALLEGVTLVNQQLMNVFKKFNCQPIESLGQEFDPNVHEAISQASSAEYAAGKVMYVAGQGYKLFDRVIRPSQVIVSTGT